jgi:Alginate export
VKYIPLKEAPGWYLSLGAESRWRFENFRNPGFGSQPEDTNGYFLGRTLFDSDWHFGTHARLFIEFQNAMGTGRVGGPRPTDENHLDIHQAFADIAWKSSSHGIFYCASGSSRIRIWRGND